MPRTPQNAPADSKTPADKKAKASKDKPPAFLPRSPPSIVSPSEALDALAADTRPCREAYLELKEMPDDPNADIFVCGPHDKKIRLVRVQAPKLKELLCTMCGLGWPKLSHFRLASRPDRIFIRCDECVKEGRGPFACYDLLHNELSAFPSNVHTKKTKDTAGDGDAAVPPPTPNPANALAVVAPPPANPAGGAASGSPASGTGRVPFTPENVNMLFKAILSAHADRQPNRQSGASVSPSKSTSSKGTGQASGRSVASGVPSSSKTSAGSAPPTDDEAEVQTGSRSRAVSNASSVRTAADDSAPRALAPFPLKRAGLITSREITVLLEHLDHAMDSYKILINNNKLEFSTLAIYCPVLAKPNKRPIALELFNRSKREWVRFGRYSWMPVHPAHNKVIGRFVHSPGLSLEDEIIEISDEDSPPKARKKRCAGAQAGPSTLKKRRGADEDEDPFGFFS